MSDTKSDAVFIVRKKYDNACWVKINPANYSRQQVLDSGQFNEGYPEAFEVHRLTSLDEEQVTKLQAAITLGENPDDSYDYRNLGLIIGNILESFVNHLLEGKVDGCVKLEGL